MMATGGRSGFSWDNLHNAWTVACLSMDIPLDKGVSFTEILVPSPGDGRRIGVEIVDWWPVAEVNYRRSALAQHGVLASDWNTRKGTIHTAELLFQSQSNPEAQAAILLAASAWDKQHSPPEAWHGGVVKLLDQVLYAVIRMPESPFTQLEMAVWHNRMRGALPLNIVDWSFAQSMKPRTYRDFAHMAVIEAALSTSLWTLVVVSHDTRGLRSVP